MKIMDLENELSKYREDAEVVFLVKEEATRYTQFHLEQFDASGTLTNKWDEVKTVAVYLMP